MYGLVHGALLKKTNSFCWLTKEQRRKKWSFFKKAMIGVNSHIRTRQYIHIFYLSFINYIIFKFTHAIRKTTMFKYFNAYFMEPEKRDLIKIL